ncbi:DsbA family oxidoreductase [Priestia megaterium]|nr:DsbA family oxidoreductase [Priestia megaterium]
MTVKIEIYSDFVCPFCFLGKKTLNEAVAGKNVNIEWKPFELRPALAEQISTQEPYIQQSWEQSLKPLAARLGVKMDLPAIDPIPRTHLAHEGFQFAKKHGKENAYVDAVFKAYWESGKDISKVAILADIADEIGLDRHIFTLALKERTFEQVHREQIDYACNVAKVIAVPTFKIGNRTLHGLTSKETIEQAIFQANERGAADGENCRIDGC